MYVKKKEVMIVDLNVWFDKTTKEIKGLVNLYDNWLSKVFLDWPEEVKQYFDIDKLPKTDEDMKNLRKELKEIYKGFKMPKYTIYGKLNPELLKSDTI